MSLFSKLFFGLSYKGLTFDWSNQNKSTYIKKFDPRCEVCSGSKLSHHIYFLLSFEYFFPFLPVLYVFT